MKRRPKSSKRIFANRRRSLRKGIRRIEEALKSESSNSIIEGLRRELVEVEQALAENIRVSQNMSRIEAVHRSKKAKAIKQGHKVSKYGSGGYEVSGGLPSLGKKK